MSSLQKLVGTIVLNLRRIPTYNDEPRFFHYSAAYGKNRLDAGGGVSWIDENKAIIRSLGEAAERYCCTNYIINPLFSSVSKLKSFVNPQLISQIPENLKLKYSEFQFNDDSIFGWVRSRNVTSGKIVWIPAQAVYNRYNFNQNKTQEPILKFPISTGAAGHFNKEDAIANGICEIIERDCCMLSYLMKIKLHRISHESCPPNVTALLSKLKRYKLSVTILDSSLDWPMSSVIVVLEDISDNPIVKFAFGSKCSFELENAIISSIEEALHYRHYVRRLVQNRQIKKISKKMFYP